MPEIKQISTRGELVALARELGVRADWHEPDEQEIHATFGGTEGDFDNAGFWGHWPDGEPQTYGDGRQEMYVTLFKEGEPVAEVNLATLFAWATGYEADVSAGVSREVKVRAKQAAFKLERMSRDLQGQANELRHLAGEG